MKTIRVWMCAVVVGAVSAGAALFAFGAFHVHFDRRNLPDLGTFTRFEFPTIGRIYDANGQRAPRTADELTAMRVRSD